VGVEELANWGGGPSPGKIDCWIILFLLSSALALLVGSLTLASNKQEEEEKVHSLIDISSHVCSFNFQPVKSGCRLLCP